MMLRFKSSVDRRELTAILSVLLVLVVASLGRLSAQEETSSESQPPELNETNGEAPEAEAAEAEDAEAEDAEAGPEAGKEGLNAIEEPLLSDGKLDAAPGDSEEQNSPREPSWIHEGNYTDSEKSVVYLLIEAGGHSELAECENDFEREMIRVAKRYVDGLSFVPGVWDKLQMTPSELRKHLVPDRDYVKEHENEFGTAYLKYGQFAFDETFRGQVRQVYRESLQRERVNRWGLGLGCMLGGLAVVSFVLRKRS